jgi:hypothetical protein
MNHTFEDYLHLFPPHKKLSRGNLLCEAAERAARSVSIKIKSEHGDDEAISSLIGNARAEIYVEKYLNSLITFKMMNKIGPKSRVEPSKIAAILIKQFYREPITDLFSFKDGYSPEKSSYPSVVRGTFLNRIAYTCLGLPKSFVEDSLGVDLLKILVKEDVSNERLMSVLFKGVFVAHGDAFHCLKD